MTTSTVPVTIPRRDTSAAIVVTATARAKLAELRERDAGVNSVVRLTVQRGGCAGLTYKLSFDEDSRPGDHVTEHGNVRIAVDRQSLSLIRGMTLDYQDGLTGAGFTFDNPLATASCGCGHSFA